METLKRKGKMVGSKYPGKLIFDGIQYQISRLNEVTQILYKLDNGFSKKKRWTNRSKFRFAHFGTVSGNWFEPLGRFIESLLYVNRYKLIFVGFAKSGLTRAFILLANICVNGWSYDASLKKGR
jgi:hypothetical protein